MRGDEHETAHAGGGGRARRIGDAGNVEGGGFRRERGLGQRVGLHFGRIELVQVEEIAREALGIGERGEGILRRHSRHGHGALGERRGVEAGIGRNAGDTLADKDPEGEFVALGGVGALHLAEAHGDRFRPAAHHDGIGLVGARPSCVVDQLLRTVAQVFGIDCVGHEDGLSFPHHLLCGPVLIKADAALSGIGGTTLATSKGVP